MRIVITFLLAAVVIPAMFAAHHTPASFASSNRFDDVISGEWDMVVNNQGNTSKLKLRLKLEGENVSGNFESSTPLGNGPVSGVWRDGKFLAKVETSHATLTLTATLKNGKLAGDWDSGHMTGKWEATKKKG